MSEQNEKILVIEDDPTGATLVSFLLKSHNYDVTLAADGEAPLHRSHNPVPIIHKRKRRDQGSRLRRIPPFCVWSPGLFVTAR